MNPYYYRIHQSIIRQGLKGQMGYKLGRVNKGYVEIILPHSSKITNQGMGFHGGAIGTIGDVAAGYAGLTVAPEGMEVATVEYKINFLSAHTSGTLVAVGTTLKPGKRIIVSSAEIYHIDEASEPGGVYDPMGKFEQETSRSPEMSPAPIEPFVPFARGRLCAILQMTLATIPKSY